MIATFLRYLTLFVLAVALTAAAASPASYANYYARQLTAPRPFDNVCTTRFDVVNQKSYPAFTFSYPDGWELSSSVGSETEEIQIAKSGTSLAVHFAYEPNPQSIGRTHLQSVSKVANSGFWPCYVQGQNQAGLGPFMVAEVELATIDMQARTYPAHYLAVVPEAATNDPSIIYTGRGAPEFDYAGAIGFWCLIPEGGISDEDRTTVIQILSSFSNGITQEQHERALLAWMAAPDAFRR